MKKLILILLSFTFCLGLAFNVSAIYDPKPKGDVSIRLEILESKNNYGRINFSLQEAEIVNDADYSNLMVQYNSGREAENDYTLIVYNSNRKEIAKYFLMSSRYFLYDGETPESGGMKEESSGTIATWIPYSLYNRPVYIKIKHNTSALLTDFMLLPTKKLLSEYNSIRFCIPLNKEGTYLVDKCCEGLTESQKTTEKFVCTKCGDNICSGYEDYWSCSNDCKYPTAQVAQEASFISRIFSSFLAVLLFPFNFLASILNF